MQHHTHSGVLYAEDFDAPEPTSAAAPPPPAPEPVVLEPTFSLTDLRRAAERAQQEGRTLERQEAELDAAARRTEALMRIADALNQARSDTARIATEAATATVETMLAMVATVLPAFARTRGQDEAGTLLGLLLPAMSHEPRLTIRVHPTLIEGLRQELASLLEDSSAAVEWLGSETMQPGDVTVRWENGTMVRDVRALCAQVAALVMPGSAQIDTTQETHDGQ